MTNSHKSNNTKNSAVILQNWSKCMYTWQLKSQTQLLAQSNNTSSSSQQHHEQQVNSTPTPQLPTTPIQQQQPQNVIYKIPSVYRRLLSESFDTFYIQFIKIFILYFVVNYTSYLNEESLNLTELFESILTALENIEENNGNLENTAFQLSYELLTLEFIYFAISFTFETVCLYKYGHTPGKYLFKLKVLHCCDVQQIPNQPEAQLNRRQRTLLVNVQPGTRLSFKSIVLRTMLKNLTIIFLFPTIMVFFAPAFMEYGQTSYDKAAESIVVQTVQ